jgi:hypothetical protein
MPRPGHMAQAETAFDEGSAVTTAGEADVRAGYAELLQGHLT